MPEVLKKLVASPAVRRAAVALVVAVLAALGVSLSGCSGQLSPKMAEAIRELECEARAIAPYVEPVYDAAELLRDTYAGKVNLPRVLRALGASDVDLAVLGAALGACQTPKPPEPLPEGVQASR